MPLTTAEREKRIADTIDYFHTHNGTIPVRKVARKYKVNHATMWDRVHNKHQSLTTNGGLNRLLTALEVDAIVLYT
jgi:hypothetical protein